MPLVKKYEKTEDEEKWKCKKCNRRWSEKPTTIINKTANPLLLKCRIEGEHKVEKYEGYKSRSLESEREIEWRKNDPLNEELKEYINSCKDLLFPHPNKPREPMGRSYAYVLITEVDDDIWPHWLRAQRACQLADELDFTLEDRQNWFDWESDEYPRLYGSRKYEMRDKWRKPKRRIK